VFLRFRVELVHRDGCRRADAAAVPASEYAEADATTAISTGTGTKIPGTSGTHA
jgi:hypothetical protein